jgi:putative ABC transport system permease protein
LGRRRVATWLIGVFACLALALAVIGVYWVMSYDVSQRAREIGIRMALGADRRDLLRLVLGAGLKLAALGVGAGGAIAFGFARVAGGLLLGGSPGDPLTYAGLGKRPDGLGRRGGLSAGAACNRPERGRSSARLRNVSALQG